MYRVVSGTEVYGTSVVSMVSGAGVQGTSVKSTVSGTEVQDTSVQSTVSGTVVQVTVYRVHCLVLEYRVVYRVQFLVL